MSEEISAGLLSQDEVDSLLNLLAEGGEIEDVAGFADMGAEAVRLYDFHQPDRLNKEHLRTLRMIHENMARRLALQLSTKLRTSIEVKLAVIETGTYAAFLQQIAAAPGAMHLLSLKPLPGRMLLQYDSRLADMLVDRLLGGMGRPRQTDDERELTDLEMELLSAVSNDVMDVLRDSWHGTIELAPKLEEKHVNPFFLQLALPTDICAWLSFETSVNGHGAALNLCIPASVLKPIAPKLSPQAWIAGSGQENDEEDWTTVRKHVRRHLDKLEMELTAVLRGGDLTFSELMALQVGDVIPLQRHISETVALTMQDQDKMEGHLGMHRGKIAVEVTTVLDDVIDALPAL